MWKECGMQNVGCENVRKRPKTKEFVLTDDDQMFLLTEYELLLQKALSYLFISFDLKKTYDFINVPTFLFADDRTLSETNKP